MTPAPAGPSRADELRALRERVRAATGPLLFGTGMLGLFLAFYHTAALIAQAGEG